MRLNRLEPLEEYQHLRRRGIGMKGASFRVLNHKLVHFQDIISVNTPPPTTLGDDQVIRGGVCVYVCVRVWMCVSVRGGGVYIESVSSKTFLELREDS